MSIIDDNFRKKMIKSTSCNRFSVVFEGFAFDNGIKEIQSTKEGNDQESIKSNTTHDPGFQWESGNFTIRNHKRELRGQDARNFI